MQRDRLRLCRIERAVRRMRRLDRNVFLAIRVDDMIYSEVAARFDLTVAEVERRFADSLDILMQTMEEKDPWWRRFRPW